MADTLERPGNAEKMPTSSGRGATLVAAGILLSRLVGLVRQKLFAYFLGNGLEAAAFSAAMRIPNFLQNLLGEGVLSASFIPVYAGLRAEGKTEEADRVAGAVFGLLALLVGGLVAAGLLAAPLLVMAIAPGYSGHSFELTVRLVRIIFPGTGVLVLSAWCLGILNSHKRFFLSYAAPVVWNLCIVAALIAFRGPDLDRLITFTAWGVAVGGVVQFAVQVPNVMRLLGHFAPRPSVSQPAVRTVLKSFVPAVAARGVVQISAYVDTAYASLITERAVSALTYAQTIALLPVSLFGMAISAAELPDMSAEATKGREERVAALRSRLTIALERIVFFVVPSAAAFLLLGDLIAGVLLESGRFTARDSRYVWYILMGSGVALLAQTTGRLYSSAFYALKDTRTPLRFAMVRVGLGAVLGYYAVRIFPAQVGLPAELGAVFITVTSGVMAWVEMTLLRRALTREIGALPPLAPRVLKLWLAALAAAGVALAVKVLLTVRYGPRPAVLEEWGGSVLPAPALPTLFQFDLASMSGVTRVAAAVAQKVIDHAIPLGLLGVFGAIYFVLTAVLGVPQGQAIVRRVLGRFSRK